MTHGDPQALAKAIHSIILPERFKYMDGRALARSTEGEEAPSCGIRSLDWIDRKMG